MSKNNLTFVHISDTHIHADPNYTNDFVDYSSHDIVQSVIDAVNNLPMPIDFVMHTGDVADSPEAPEHYHIARELLNQINHPVYYCPGNHDNSAMFQEHFLGIDKASIQPNYDQEFEVNGVQIIMMDSLVPPEIQSAAGYITAEQLNWLDSLCRADDNRPLIVGLHHHPIALQSSWLDQLVLKNGIALHNTLLKAKHRLRGVFYGHIHEHVVTMREGISYYSVVSGWFQTQTWHGAEEPMRGYLRESGFNLVTITDVDTFVRPIRIPLK